MGWQAVARARDKRPPMSRNPEPHPAPADELVLQLREAQLRGILDSASEGIVTVDATQTIVMANRAAACMFGCKVEDLIGSPLARLLPEPLRLRHAEALAAFGAAESPARRMGGRRELRALRADGRSFPIEAGISQAHVDGMRLYTVILRDLSEERQAADALQHSNRLLAATFSVSNVGIVHVDVGSRRIGAVNKAFCRLSGYSEAELVGQPIDLLNHPEEPFDPAGFARIVQGDGDGRSERRLVRRDGTSVWIELSGSVVTDGAGQPARVVGVVQDISARRAAEDALRAREARLAFLVRLNDLLRALDEPPRIIAEASRLLGEFIGADRVGYAEDGGDGDSIEVVRHHTHLVLGLSTVPHIPPYVDHLLAAFRAGRTVVRPDIPGDPALSAQEKAAHAALQLGATVNVPLRRGEQLIAVFFVHARQPRAWTADEVALIEGVAERIRADIARARAESAMRASKAELEAALASMNDAVYIADTDGRLVHCNAAFASFHRTGSLADSPHNLAEWQDLLDVRTMDGQVLPIERWAVPRALRGESGSHLEQRLRRRDNGETWIGSYSYAPIRQPDGRIGGAVVTARDITDLRRMHDELADAHAELQQLVAAQDRVQEQERLRIARELHDDLQQHLAAIGMEAASVQAAAQAADPAIGAALARIERIALQTISAARRIIQDLRPEALEEMGLVAALDRLAQRFQRRSGIEVRLDAGALAEADVPQLATQGTCLYRVTQEALTNVARHARARSVRITLASRPGHRVRLVIADDGIGLPAADDRRGRQRFGLLGMRERLRAAGGSLQLRSTPGQGCEIEAELPLSPGAD